MKKIFVFMGKSSSGKDTLFKELLKSNIELDIVPYVLYTTRPMRENEENGKDYFFVSDETFDKLISEGKMIEYRAYDTVHGVWKYGTVSDNQFNTDKNIAIILTLEGYNSLVESNVTYNEDIIPIYIEVEDGERLTRALAREKQQKQPKYKELCRRFIADSEDFSEENLQTSKINIRFENNNLEDCLNKIKDYIVSFNS